MTAHPQYRIRTAVTKLLCIHLKCARAKVQTLRPLSLEQLGDVIKNKPVTCTGMSLGCKQGLRLSCKLLI